MKRQRYQVIVCGSVLYESSDGVMAGAVAQTYKDIGWPSVRVFEKGKNIVKCTICR